VETGDPPAESDGAPGQRPAAAEPARPRRRGARLRRFSIRIGVALVLLGALGVGFVRWRFHGENLADFVANRIINPGIKGRVEIDRIDWPIADLVSLRHVRGTAYGLRVFDEHHQLVLWAEKATFVIDAWEIVKPSATIFRSTSSNIIIHELKLDAGWARVVEVATPGSAEHDSVVAFVDAFSPKRKLDAAAAKKAAAREGMIFNIHNADLSGVDLDLEFSAWEAHLHDVSAKAWLWMDGRDHDRPEFMFRLDDARIPAAGLSLFGTQFFALHDIHVPLYGMLPDDPDDMVYEFAATTAEGARVTGGGVFADMSNPPETTVTLDLATPHAGRAASHWLPKGLEGVDLSAAGAELHLRGPVADLILTAQATGVGIRAPGAPPLELVRGEVTWPLAERKSTPLTIGADVAGLGGGAHLGGEVYFEAGHPPTLNVDLALAPAIDIGAYLPPDLVKTAGGTRLAGTLRVRGTPDDVWADPVDVTLGDMRAVGGVNYIPGDGTVLLKGLQVDAPSLAATAKGSGRVNLVTRQLALGFTASAEMLGPWLRRMQQPLVATAAQARGVVGGTFDAPQVTAQVSAQGVPITGRADARIDYRAGVLWLKELRASPLGGSLVAAGRVRLGVRPTLDNVFVSAADLNLAKIPGVGPILAGIVGFDVTAAGDLRRPRVTLVGRGRGLAASGEPLGDLDLELHTGDSGLVVDRLVLGDAERTAQMNGAVGWNGALDLHLEAQRIPIASLPMVAKDPGLGADGTVSLDVNIRGTREMPQIDGGLRLAQIAFGQTILGAGRLELEPDAGGEVRFSGELFQGKFVVEGSAQARPPWHAKLNIAFRRVEIDEFTTYASLYGVSGWATGAIEIELADTVRYALRVDELYAEVAGSDERGRPTPVVVRAKSPIRVRFDGQVARLDEPMVLATNEGEFTVSGSAGQDALNVDLAGKVQLGLLRAFTHRYIDRVAGVATADVRVRGTARAPRLEGSLALADVVVVPRGTEAELGVPSGRIVLSNDKIAAERLQVAVDGESLTLNGGLTLAAWKPAGLDATIKGRLAARLFEVAAGAQVSNAAGSAALDVRLGGRLEAPTVEASLVFDQPFELGLRDLRRQVIVKRGAVRLDRTGHLIITDQISGAVDDGSFTLAGDVRLKNWALDTVDVNARLVALAFRVPKLLELEANAQLRLHGDRSQLYLAGGLEIVDGRYFQPFSLVNLLIVPERTSEKSVPFWVGQPLLERLGLDLTVTTNGVFAVNNNIAQEMALSGNISVTGTPPDPRLEGRITVENGRIKLPLTKPVFAVESGEIRFDRYQKALAGTTVAILAHAEHRDREDREHMVTLSITGPLTRLVIDMSTDTGLNFAQTLILIGFNRTQDEIRQQARGDEGRVVSQGGGSQSVGGSGDGTLSEADRVVKDVFGDVVSAIIEDPIKKTFPLDCVRLEVGTESAQFYTCLRVGRRVKLEGEVEYGYQGQNRLRGGANGRINNSTSVIIDYEIKSDPNDDTQSKNRQRYELKFRFIIP
jgi:hypothetical protein